MRLFVLQLYTKFEVSRPSNSALSSSRPGDLDLLTLKLVRVIAPEVGYLPVNFGISGTFHSRLMGHHLTLTFDLGGNGACR